MKNKNIQMNLKGFLLVIVAVAVSFTVNAQKAKYFLQCKRFWR